MNANVDIPQDLIDTLSTSTRIVALTGSGISAESGVPTFREAQTGLWSRYDPLELATPQAFQRNPGLVWQWYSWRRQLVSQASPNPAHQALVDLENLVPHFTLITQNVDGLHQRAGSSAFIELHGNITRTKCSVEGNIVDTWSDDQEKPPHCPICGGKLRPDVVWFGENLSETTLSEAITAARSCDLFFSIGTSAVVQPAASLPLYALKSGATVVEINIAPTLLTSQVDYSLHGPACQVLPSLLDAASLG